ncbi:hypothetical protein HMPREF9555_01993 [Selenomonas artemidis F0399]|uniref:Uncharacterized protein n=1 Tax=Selenomonas artemidis F0399 TaxID=749551 RepID=E7N4P4_9FIRM|nr:hypothetical protein HMPREF9555_01993 [Selenomonas artemidis F0399]
MERLFFVSHLWRIFQGGRRNIYQVFCAFCRSVLLWLITYERYEGIGKGNIYGD